jgi:hypothetical protein
MIFEGPSAAAKVAWHSCVVVTHKSPYPCLLVRQVDQFVRLRVARIQVSKAPASSAGR